MKNKGLSGRVKELRNRKGLSQEALAEDSGVSLRTIQRIEKGESDPTGDTLKRIANALDVTPNDLIDWTIKEDSTYLKTINLSALFFLIFPFLGILLPFIFWSLKKDKIKGVNELGTKVVNYQITWTIALILLPAIVILILKALNGTYSIGIPVFIVFIIIMYLTNIISIIRSTIKISKGKAVKYFPTINFIKH